MQPHRQQYYSWPPSHSMLHEPAVDMRTLVNVLVATCSQRKLHEGTSIGASGFCGEYVLVDNRRTPLVQVADAYACRPRPSILAWPDTSWSGINAATECSLHRYRKRNSLYPLILCFWDVYICKIAASCFWPTVTCTAISQPSPIVHHGHIILEPLVLTMHDPHPLQLALHFMIDACSCSN